MKTSTRTSEIRVLFTPKDFAVTRRFYTEVIGWPIHHEWENENDRGVMFNPGCAIIEFISSGKSTATPRGVKISLRVEDVWSLWQELQKQAPIVYPLRQSPWGDDSFCIADPDGLHLIFFTGHADEQAKPIG